MSFEGAVIELFEKPTRRVMKTTIDGVVIRIALVHNFNVHDMVMSINGESYDPVNKTGIKIGKNRYSFGARITESMLLNEDWSIVKAI